MQDFEREIHEQNNQRKLHILKGFVEVEDILEKAKANIGDIRDWKDGKYRKIADGEWEKIGDKKSKKVATSTMLKTIKHEMEQANSDFMKAISDFKKSWQEANPEINITFIRGKLMMEKDLSESVDIEKARKIRDSILEDLREDYQEVKNIYETLQRKKREERTGKKEIHLGDDWFIKKTEDYLKIEDDLKNSIKDMKETITPIEALGRKVSPDDYWLDTETHFDVLIEYTTELNSKYNTSDSENWIDPIKAEWKKLMKENPKLEHTHSPKSSSEYLVDREKNLVYRMADHWGRCASCFWSFGGEHHYGIGISKFEDFKRNEDGRNFYVNNKRLDVIKQSTKKSLKFLNKLINEKGVYFDKETTEYIRKKTDIINKRFYSELHLNQKEIDKYKDKYEKLFNI